MLRSRSEQTLQQQQQRRRLQQSNAMPPKADDGSRRGDRQGVEAPASPKMRMHEMDMSVKDIAPDAVPLYAFDAGRRQFMRKVRSFGDFSVPDVDMNDSGDDTSLSDDLSRPASPARESDDDDTDNGAIHDGDDAVAPVLEVNTPIGASGGSNRSLFDHHVCTGWDECVKLQKFKYDLSTTESRTLPGTLGFVAQLNEGRATKKRQTEFRIDTVNQDFDENKFNFNKVSGSEVLFRFEPVDDEGIVPDVPSPFSDNQSNASFFVTEWEEPPHVHASPNLVIINVSPIEYGHILLVPRVKDNLPQQVTPSTMHFALQMAAESNNPFFRIGFNSLGAYGSVNHLHFQGYYLDAPFAVERAPTVPLPDVPSIIDDVRVMQLSSYPVRGIVMEIVHDEDDNDSDSDDNMRSERCPLDRLATLCGNACAKLARENIPYNIFIVDGGSRLFLFPQCFQKRIATGRVPDWVMNTGVNPAAFEISGHLLMKTREDFDSLSEEKACELLQQVSLGAEEFINAAKLCLL